MQKVRFVCVLSVLFMAGCQGQYSGTGRPGGVIKDKTLVAWVSPSYISSRSRGALSLMSGEAFDAIVLKGGRRRKGKRPGKWIADSDRLRRTEMEKSSYEAIEVGKIVQIAIVYSGKHITIYRDGQVYASYDANSQQEFGPETKILVGLRYGGTMEVEDGYFIGDIEEVRLYNAALCAEAIKKLRPEKMTLPRPAAMWTFEGGSVSDVMNNYPNGRLIGGASIVNGKLHLNGRGQYMLVSDEEPPQKGNVQAGFYTPARRGLIWDTWIYYHKGKYYMYYLGGQFLNWWSHELAVSDDGVHWREYGTIIKPGEGAGMGTGHIWKSGDFESSGKWVINYSEWRSKQSIMFATSTDLVNWTKVDEKLRFVQDTRWYKKGRGRWDCIDALKREDGSFYGYFTANPAVEKLDYTPCGFGFAESKDGIRWTALPPVEGEMHGEFGGINKIGDKYYIIVSDGVGQGRVGVSDRPEGPFLPQKKNYNLFGKDCDIHFPRFFHNAPGGPLVNHFYAKSGGDGLGGLVRTAIVYSAPLKDVEVDNEGILRMKWWKNNEKLKNKEVSFKLSVPEKGCSTSILMLSKKLDLTRVVIIEGTVKLSDEAEAEQPGIFFDDGGGRGQCLLFTPNSTGFGTMNADGSKTAIVQTISRDINFGYEPKYRVVMKHDMMEVYLNDYLMTLKRVPCNGNIGLVCSSDKCEFKDIRIWQSK